MNNTNPTPSPGLSSKEAPAEIYLQWHGDARVADDGDLYTPEVTWSASQVFPRDIKYVRATELSNIEQSMFVFAARYAHDRPTGASLQVVRAIEMNWSRLSEETKKQLKDESEYAMFNQDDWAKMRDLP